MRHIDDIAGFLWHLAQFRQVHIAASYGAEVVDEVLRRYEERWDELPRVRAVSDKDDPAGAGWILEVPGVMPDHLITLDPDADRAAQDSLAEDASSRAPLQYALDDLPPDVLEQIANLPDLPADEIPVDPAVAAGDNSDLPKGTREAMDLLYETLVEELADPNAEILDPADAELLAEKRRSMRSDASADAPRPEDPEKRSQRNP